MHRSPFAVRRLAALAGLVAFMAAAGCSTLVERAPTQCKTDDDCIRFGGRPLCQAGICVASGLGPEGCFYGTPDTEDNLLNQCTTGKCEPYDNCGRLQLCSGAALPPLVPQPDAGVPKDKGTPKDTTAPKEAAAKPDTLAGQ
jgi:hypothetical protein